MMKMKMHKVKGWLYMARQPKVIPFSETMPSDDFQVEQINDDEVLTGPPLG